MLRHYFTFAFRNLLRNKFHSFINILGLAIGVSACLVIYLIVNHELSFNTSIPDADRIYRLHPKSDGSGGGYNHGAGTGVAPYVIDNFKGIENVSLFFTYEGKVSIPQSSEQKQFYAHDRIAIAGADYFKTFTFYKWLAGSSKALVQPRQVVLIESQARKYFGNVSFDKMIGKQVIYSDSLETTVAGILADVDIQTDFDFTDFISFPTIQATWLKNTFILDDWYSTYGSSQVFVKAQIGTTYQRLLEQLPLLTKASIERNELAKARGSGVEFEAQPISDLHFNTELGIFDHSPAPAHRSTLLALSAVAILLLVIGAINFINLETALAVRRAKEIGVRKVLGSTRSRLVFQFLSESLLITFISVLLALPLTELSLLSFSEFIPSGVSLNLSNFIPFLFLIVVFIGLLASAYPAFVLSSFLPALVLKNQAYSSTQSRTSLLRQLLIVFQFTFAQVLIIGTIVVTWQVRYLVNRDLGFKKNAIIYFKAPEEEDGEKTGLLKTELGSIPEIQKLAMSDQPPATSGWSTRVLEFKGQTMDAYLKYADSAYLRFYHLKLLAGRNLQPSDTLREIVVNEELTKQLGFEIPREAIDKVVKFFGRKVSIVGVVQDFHFRSLHHTVEPVAITYQRNFNCFNIELAAANKSGKALKASLQKIEQAWKKIYPNSSFKYYFLDESIRKFYETEQRTAKLTTTAMALAIFISCLGLFGLVSYMSLQRTKEVGIRKVMGASAPQIVLLLSKDFLTLVFVSFVLASPIAWYVINQWLQSFPYRTDLNMWVFALTAVIAVAVAFVTMSYQTLNTASANPVESLRSE